MNQSTATNLGMIMKARKALLRLELWYAFDRAVNAGQELGQVLLRETCVWAFFPWHLSADPPETPVPQRRLYGETYRRVEDAFARCAARREHDRFVAEACRVLDPLVDEWLAECARRPPAERVTFGCFGYNVSSADPAEAALHFHNACWPRSPFEDLIELADDLRQCLLDIRRNHPAVTRISCGSWINGHGEFLRLFPESYAHSLVPTSPESKGFGWWGQFVRKDGSLNEKRAAEFRRTGRFAFPRLLGTCPLDELLDHLETHFPPPSEKSQP